MKKILFLVLFLLALGVQGQIINPQSVVIGGGSSDPALDQDAVEVTSESVLSAVGSQNKNLYITTDITLTGNVSLADGAMLIGAGGTISNGGFEWTFTNFRGFDVIGSKDQTIIDFSTGSINASSTFIATDFVLDWLGLVGDGTYPALTGTDNRNVLLEGSELVNIQSQGTLHILNPGRYLYSMVDVTGNYKNTPNNFYIRGDSHIVLHEGVELGGIGANGNVGDAIITVWQPDYASITGEGGLIGDARVQIPSESNRGTNKRGITIIGPGDGVDIDLGYIKETCGSGVVAIMSQEFVYNNNIVEADWTKNFDLSSVDGSATAQGDLAYSDRFDITSSLFTNLGSLAFGRTSFGGTGKHGSDYCFIVFYDNTSSDGSTTTGFLGKTEVVPMNSPVQIPEDATHIRVVAWQPPNNDWTDYDTLPLGIMGIDEVEDVNIKVKYIQRGVFQGISNPPAGSTIEGINFFENGRFFTENGGTTVWNEIGFTGWPGYAIDVEDGYDRLRRGRITKNHFKNNKGGAIILKSSKDYTIDQNYFWAHTIPGFTAVKSISLSAGYKTLFTNNHVEDYQLTVGRGDLIANNKLYDTELLVSFENSTIENNQGYNVRMNIDSGQDTTQTMLTYVRNNTFVYDKPLDPVNDILVAQYGMALENTNFLFEEGAVFGADNEMFSVSSLSGAEYPTTRPWGYIDKMRITNIQGESLYSDAIAFYAYDVKDLTSSGSVQIRNGSPADFTWENIDITGWFWLRLDDFANTATGSFPTATMRDVEVYITDPDHLQFTRDAAFETETKDVDVEWIGGTIDFTALGDVSEGDDFLELKHNGTTLFENFPFKTAYTSANISLSLSSCGVITFTDCTLNGVALQNGTNITLRGGDIIN